MDLVMQPAFNKLAQAFAFAPMRVSSSMFSVTPPEGGYKSVCWNP